MVIDQEDKPVTAASKLRLCFSSASSAVHVLCTIVERDVRMVSVRGSVGPSQWRAGMDVWGPWSYIASIGDCGAHERSVSLRSVAMMWHDRTYSQPSMLFRAPELKVKPSRTRYESVFGLLMRYPECWFSVGQNFQKLGHTVRFEIWPERARREPTKFIFIRVMARVETKNVDFSFSVVPLWSKREEGFW
jgi:hypothetical protein